MNNPLVSFCILSYNQEKYIAEALESVIHQKYDNLEIIISDDCSTDGTYKAILNVVAKYQDKYKIILNRNEHNMGLISHFNYILENMVHSDYILLMGGDDVSTADRTQKTVDYFLSDSEIGGVVFSYKIIDSEGKFIKNAAVKKDRLYSLQSAQWFSSSSFVIGGLALAFRKSCYDLFGPLRDCHTEDSTMRFRIILISKFLYSRSVCMSYRRHETNITSSSNMYNLKTSDISNQYLRDLNMLRNRGVLKNIDYKRMMNKIDWYRRKRTLLEESYKSNHILNKIWFQIMIRILNIVFYVNSKRILFT